MRQKISLDLATRLVNHGPLVLISSMFEDKIDITPIAWHMPVSKRPPLLAFEISETHFIYKCIMDTKDFAVNIPSRDLLRETVMCGSGSGADVDKMRLTGLTTEMAREIKSPVLRAAMGVLECALVEDKYLLEKYNIVLGEVKYAEADPATFREHWLLKSNDMKTIHHLGNMTFCVPEDTISL